MASGSEVQIAGLQPNVGNRLDGADCCPTGRLVSELGNGAHNRSLLRLFGQLSGGGTVDIGFEAKTKRVRKAGVHQIHRS